MSLSIQTNVVTPQNKITFKGGNVQERMAWTARKLAELGGPKIEAKNRIFFTKNNEKYFIPS